MASLRIVVKEHVVFFTVLALCGLLRLLPLFSYQFTLDELSGLDRTYFDSFGELIDKGVKIDAHPALVQVLIYYLAHAFNYSTWIIKLPFLLFGFGAVIYAYVFALRNFSKQAAVLSATLFSFSLIFVFYAPIARMYISGVFFSIALLYYFFEIIFNGSKKLSHYVLLGVFALLCALNQHINALFACTLCASGLLFLSKANMRRYLLTCVFTVICYLPHLPVTLYQLGVGGIGYEQGGWLEAPKLMVVFDLIKVLLGTGKTWILFLLAVLLSLAQDHKAPGKKQWFLLLIFLVNYLVVYAYSALRAPVFQYSVMLFSATALLLFICSLMEFKSSRVFYSAFVVLALALIYKSYVKKDYLHQAVKTVFEYQFERTAYYKQKYGEASVYPVFFDADATMKKVYFKTYKPFDCKTVADAEANSMKAFSQFVAGLHCDYLVLASSMPAQQAVARDYFPYLIENTQTQAINYKVYSKRVADKQHVVADDKVLLVSTPAQRAVFTYLKLKQPVSAPVTTVSDSLNEYPFDAAAAYEDVVTHEGQVLLLKAKVASHHLQQSQITGCISVNDAVTNEVYMYGADEAQHFVPHDSSVTIYASAFFGTQHKKAEGNSKITCYVWNRGREKFSLQDFEIRVIDFWPRKWQFWE